MLFGNSFTQAVHQPRACTGANVSSEQGLFQFVPEFIGDRVFLEGFTEHTPEELARAAQTILEGIKALLGQGFFPAFLGCLVSFWLLFWFLAKESIEHDSIYSL
jgi:hypothetical protein